MTFYDGYSQEQKDRIAGSRPLEDWEIDQLNEVEDEDKPWAKGSDDESNARLVSETG